MKHLLNAALIIMVCFISQGNADVDFEARENLLVFVGSAQNYEDIPCETDDSSDATQALFVCFDAQVETVFTVEDVIFGEYESPEITVTSFDHYGRFPFLVAEYSLMFVTETDGGYVQHKYQFDEVYRVKDGGWAGCGPSPIDTSRYEGVEVMDPQPIEFESPVTIDLSMYTTEAGYDEQSKSRLLEWYSQPSFSLDGDIVTCHMGLYVDDLFKLRDETILEARRRHQN